jgi:hypothetical protein
MPISTAPASPYITLDDILGAPNLCGIIELTKSGVPNPFPMEFFKVTRKVLGNVARFTQYTGQRQTATQQTRNGPSRNRQLKELGVKDLVMITSRENIILDADDYQCLLRYDSLDVQKMGIEEVGRQIKEAKVTLDNLRVASVANVLFNGNIWFDASGNLLPSSTNAVTTTPFNVPAGNQAQLNVLGQGNIIDSTWDNTSADIVNQIVNLKQAAAALTGFPLKHAFYGRNILNFLATNTTVQAFMSRSGSSPDPKNPGRYMLDTAEIPKGLFGFEWHPCYEFNYLDQNNNNQSPVGDSAITFTPEINTNWWQYIEGSAVVPKTIDIIPDVNDGAAMSDKFEQRFGRWAFGSIIDDPITAKIQYGDTQLPGLLVPSVIMQAVVSFNS